TPSRGVTGVLRCSFPITNTNDSGFWFVTMYLGRGVGDGLKTWTVLTTIGGVAGFLLTWGVYALV
ncbi:MAG: hypothetical protein QM286_06820, partial [Acidobacteriota bacterium]|nr:hypothetical protein [Acidobacteriota bacterium]